MVGAIADWFAVTALFKHPLGLPIPHTALIPKRKDELGRGLEEFVGENFLQEDIIRERVGAAHDLAAGGRLARRPGQRAAGGRRGRRRRGDRASARSATSTSRTWSATPACRGSARSRSRRCSAACSPRRSATTCTTAWSTWRSRSCTAGWWTTPTRSPRCSASGRRGGRRRGSTRPSPSGSTSRRSAGSTTSATTPDHHARGALDSMLDPARPGPAARTRDTQERAERLKERLLDHPQVVATGDLAVERAAPALLASLRDPDGRRPPAAAGRARRRSPSGCAPTRRCAPGSTDGRRRRGLRGRAVRRRAHRRHHPHHRALGRQGGRAPDRAARRPRPPVHPDQRHHRRRPGRRADPHRQPCWSTEPHAAA